VARGVPCGNPIALSHPADYLGRRRLRALKRVCPGSPRQFLGQPRVCIEPESPVPNNENSHISERGAAVLLGLSLSDLRWYSRHAGIGQVEPSPSGGQVFFTYDDLAKLSAISAPSAD